MKSRSDTIAALATAPGPGGIAVIRVSGPQALAVADRVFEGRHRPSDRPGYTICHGFIIAKSGFRTARPSMVDEVLLSVFRAPGSYTGEDMIEISCHGGAAPADAVLRLLLGQGIRPAGPGEFTRRAVLNGKLDLTQAEAILELVNARSDQTRARAMSQLTGTFSSRIERLRQELFGMQADLTAQLEFSEELQDAPRRHAQARTSDKDLCSAGTLRVDRRLARVARQLTQLVQQAESAPLLRQGALVVIVGKPNVGKSSLFNQLAGEEKAIVTEVPGTTRDCLEASLNLDGMLIRLVDTAGWRTHTGKIEAIGKARARHYAERADTLLVVLDRSRPFGADDREVLAATADRRRIIVLNKSDLPAARHAPLACNGTPRAAVSARRGKGIAQLSKLIVRQFATARTDGDFIASRRQLDGLRCAAGAIARAQSNPALDARHTEVAAAIQALEELLGQVPTDEVLDRVFSEFCIGK